MISWFINCKTALLTKNRNTDGHANYRSDSYYTVAFWYHTEPHAPFPSLAACRGTNRAIKKSQSIYPQ